MIYAKPATSLLVVFRAFLASDHVTPATGKTIAITISKNGGAFGNPNAGATNATEISSGYYKVTLDTTDTGTNGPLAVRGAVATIDDVGVIYQVGLEAVDVDTIKTNPVANGGTITFPTNATVASTTNITAATGVDVTKWLGGTIAAVGTTGIPVVDVVAFRNTTVPVPAVTGVPKVDLTQVNGSAATSASGRPEVNVTHWLGTAASTPTVAGVPNVNAKTWNDLATVALPLIPTVAGRTLDCSAGGEAGVDWANVGTPGSANNLSGTAVLSAASVTGAVGSVTGNVGGNVVGSVGSVTGAVGSVTGAVGSVTGAVGSVTGAVGSVTGAVGSVTGNVGGNVTGSVGSLATQAKADVNAEVVDTLATDTYAEPGQGAPAATTTLAAKINYLFKFLRNKITQTSTTLSVYDDAGTTVDQKATVSDDATTYTRGEIGSGP